MTRSKAFIASFRMPPTFQASRAACSPAWKIPWASTVQAIFTCRIRSPGVTARLARRFASGAPSRPICRRASCTVREQERREAGSSGPSARGGVRRTVPEHEVAGFRVLFQGPGVRYGPRGIRGLPAAEAERPSGTGRAFRRSRDRRDLATARTHLQPGRWSARAGHLASWADHRAIRCPRHASPA